MVPPRRLEAMVDDRPIGVFDSGAGGISVLRHLMRLMPRERFAYFGDSRNTPYGDKPVEWIRERSLCVSRLLTDNLNAKAVVVACNTATAASAEFLRESLPHVPVFGIEPALKPAATDNPGGTVLVMATEATLRLDRFRLLVDRWGTGCAVVSVPCPGLADAIEAGLAGSDEVYRLVEGFVGGWRETVDAVVLGCTHYPFVTDEIRRVLGGDVRVYDGAEGTARNVSATLMRKGMLAGGSEWTEDACDPSDALMEACTTGPVAPNIWSIPDRRLLMMSSGGIPHIMQFEHLALGDGKPPVLPDLRTTGTVGETKGDGA